MPAILALGIITSYEDIKEGKIRNKWIVSALVYAFVVYAILIISFYLKGTLRTEYIIELLTNFIFAVIVGFGMWLGKLWTAGDGKLFIAYSALIPLSAYVNGYVKYFPSSALLINSFVPAFAVLFILLLVRTSLKEKKEAVKLVIEPKSLIASLSSLFVISFLLERILLKWSTAINSYFLVILISISLFSVAGYLLKRNVWIPLAALAIIVLTSQYARGLEFLKRFLGVFLVLVFVRGTIISLAGNKFSKLVKIKELKPGMLPLGNHSSDELSSAKGLPNNVAEGLSKAEAKKIISKSKGKLDSIRVKQTVPFAPFLLLGALLTMVSQGVVTTIWLTINSESIIDYIRSSVLPVIIVGIAVGFILLCMNNWKKIMEEFSGVKNKTWAWVLIVVLMSIIIRIFILQHHHIMYIDESWYMESAKNLLIAGKPVLCDYHGKDIFCSIYPKPLGWPVMLSYAFMLFGVDNYVALIFSSLLGALSCVLVFLLVYLGSKKEKPALVSSFLMVIFPLHIYYSKAAETNVPSLFFVLICLISLLLITKRPKDSEFQFMFFFSLILASLIRVENVLVAVPLVVYLIATKDIRKKGGVILWLSCSVLIVAPELVQSYLNNAQIYGGSFLSTGSFLSKTIEAIGIVTLNFNPTFIILVSIGIIFLFEQNKSLLGAAASLFLPFFVFYVSFERMQPRFFLFPAVILIVLGSLSLGVPRRHQKNKWLGILTLSAVIILVASLVPNLVTSLSPSDSRLIETEIPEFIEKELPKGCYVITDSPTVISSTTGLKVISTRTALEEPERVSEVLNDAGCVMFLEDLFCFENFAYTDNSTDRCKKFMGVYSLSAYHLFERGEIKYGLYNLSYK